MSKKRFVLPLDHYPTRMPLLDSFVAYMALDLYNAPGWVWGVAGTLLAMLWLGWLLLINQQETKPLPGYGEQKDKA